MFTDLILTDAGLNYDLQAECFSPEAGKTVTVRSAPFHVHDYIGCHLSLNTSIRKHLSYTLSLVI